MTVLFFRLDEQTPNELERTQMKRTEGRTSDQLNATDKISAHNEGAQKEALGHIRVSGGDRFLTCSSRARQTKSNSPEKWRKSDSKPLESGQRAAISTRSDESKRSEFFHGSHCQPSTATNLIDQTKRQHDERCLKRKRDESPGYKERRRITR